MRGLGLRGVQGRRSGFVPGKGGAIPPPSTLHVWFQYPRVHPYASALDTRTTPSTSPVRSLLTPSRRVTRAGQVPRILGLRHIRRAMQAREQGGGGLQTRFLSVLSLCYALSLTNQKRTSSH